LRVKLCPFSATSIFHQGKLIEKALLLKGYQVEFVKYISMADVVKKTAEAYVWLVVANPTWVAHIAGMQHGLLKRPGVKAICYATIEGIPYPHVAMTSGAQWIQYTANSFFTKQCLETVGLKVVGVIHHAIDVDEVAKVQKGVETYRKKLDKDFPGKVRFLYVGRDDHRKNISGLVEAVDHMNKRHKNEFEVFLISEAKNFKTYERPNISMVGITGNEEHETLMKWMGAVDFFTYPSVSEGFGVPVLEALAMGTPVVCNQMPPLTEFTNPEVALYYPYERVEYLKTDAEQFFQMHRYNPKDYADAMLKAIDLKTKHSDRYEDMRAKAAEHASKWDLRKIYSNIV